MSKELPLVSIITPSLNQGNFIEETILSVKNQTYFNIEHIIVDGGSTDSTIGIIKKYNSSYNMRWVSEPDKGQSDAINKGWNLAEGEILAYLNSDDTYEPRAVETIVKYFSEHHDVAMVYGDCNIINEFSKITMKGLVGEFDLGEMICGRGRIAQPAVFIRRNVIDYVGYLDTNLHMSMDTDLWIRIGLKMKMKYIPILLANFRLCQGTKSMNWGYKFGLDHLRILDKTFSSPELPKEIRKLKRQAYSYAYLRTGMGYHSRREMKQARKHLIKAIILYPSQMKRPINLLYLVTAFLGGKATSMLVKLKSKFPSNLS